MRGSGACEKKEKNGTEKNSKQLETMYHRFVLESFCSLSKVGWEKEGKRKKKECKEGERFEEQNDARLACQSGSEQV